MFHMLNSSVVSVKTTGIYLGLHVFKSHVLKSLVISLHFDICVGDHVSLALFAIYKMFGFIKQVFKSL